MRIKTLITKFPKWAIASSIFFGSTVIFALWWYNWKPEQTNTSNRATQSTGENNPAILLPSSPSQPPPPSKPITILPDSMLIGERSLYQVSESSIDLVKKDWLNFPIGPNDQVIFLESESVLAIGHPDHSISVFQTSGKRIGKLALSNGARFDGYLTDDFNEAIFLKDGDIWRGKPDWKTAKITSEKQVTNTGYFMGGPLKGRLLGASGNGMLYRDHRLGLIWVNLETGQVDSGKLPANAKPSPKGNLIIGDMSGRPPQLIIFDVDSMETSSLPIPWRIRQNALGWLDENRAVITLANEVGIYYHEKKDLSVIYRSSKEGFTVKLAMPPSPDGKHIMIEDATKGGVCIKVETHESIIVNGPSHITGMEWLSDGAFLMYADVPNTEERGTWLGHFDNEEPTRIFAQPIKSKFDSQRNNQHSVILMPTTKNPIIRAFNRWYLLEVASGNIQECNVNSKSLVPIGQP